MRAKNSKLKDFKELQPIVNSQLRIMKQLREKTKRKKRYLTARNIKLRKRKPSSHKGDNGKVLVVGGSIDYIGAVLMAGMAAFRTGVDLVVIAAPEKAALAINTFSPDFITKKFKGDFFKRRDAAKIVGMAKDFDVLLIGNGIGLRKETSGFVKEVIKRTKNKLKVIDADAIKVLKLKETSNAVITPHKGELNILMHNNRIKTLKHLRKKIGSNVLLIKGRIDTILSKSRAAYNKTGNEGMTKGGTGDVLAGITAGLLAQNKDLFKAAMAAAYINGLIGDILFKEKGYGFLASEMLDKIPGVMKRFIRK